jgi:hypothetical protein
MNRKDPDLDVEKMSLPELSALEAGVVSPANVAPHENASSEAEKQSRDVKREIGAH